MSFQNNFAPSHAAPRIYVRHSSGIFTLLVFIAAVISFLYVGRWLVVEDPLDHAQAIAILSGRVPIRALEAAQIYRQGYAKEIWLTHSTEPGKTLESLGVPYLGEEIYNTKLLIHEGVPAAAIRVLEPPILNTADEIVAIDAAINDAPLRVVIIVTTKPHTRRVRTLWRSLTREQNRAIVRASSTDPYDGDHWWHNTRDALDVVREVLGLLNTWAGLPLGQA